MESKVELLSKLHREKVELLGKIKRLEGFRRTDKWNELSVNHKQLLDIQLSAMRTYLECLIGRIIDINSKEEAYKETLPKLIIVDLGE